VKQIGNIVGPSSGLLLAGSLLVLIAPTYSYFHTKALAGMIFCSSLLVISGIAVGYYYAQRQLCSNLTRCSGCIDVVRILQVQHHDFLNHLQVLGGLAQLRKPERVMEYIYDTARELDRERTLTKLLPAEAGLLLLSWYQHLREQGVSFGIEVTNDLSQTVNGLALATLLTELFTFLLSPDFGLRELKLRSSSQELELIAFGQGRLPMTSLVRARELARKIGGTILVDQQNDMVQIRMQLQQLQQILGKK